MPEDLFSSWDELFGARPEAPQLPTEGLRRHVQLGLRGATLGLGGTQIPPQSLGESVSEFAGGIPTIAGISAALGPLAGATGRFLGPPVSAALKVPAVQRMTIAPMTGAVVGGVEALHEGKPVAETMAKTAATYGAMEGLFLGGVKILGRGLKAPEAGKTLTPSPVADVAKDEILRGQGLPPESPPQLALPMQGTRTYFDAKDYVGSGTVLNPERNPQLRVGRIVGPEEQTRRMLPEAPAQRALSEAPSRPLGPEKEVGYFEQDYHPGFEENAPPSIGYFETAHDPRINETVLIPKNAQVEEGVITAMGVKPRDSEFPLSEAQVKSLETTPKGKTDKAKLDTVTKQYPERTSILMQQPEEVVDAAVNGKGAPFVEAQVIELSPRGLEARELLTKSGISENDYIKFGSTLKGPRDEKMGQLLNWLREKCR
jgi:hypothetical protein